MRILIVEDNQDTAKFLQQLLKSEDFICDSVSTGEDGLQIARIYDYDLLILDLMLPDIEGYELLRRLRSIRNSTPVLILSGLSNTIDKIRGLDFGADDYVTKPYENAELLARVRAIIRRSKGHPDSVIKIGELEVNIETKTVTAKEIPLKLTKREYSILELMTIRKGSTLSKDTFLNHIYGGLEEPEFKIIDVFICKLRKKLTEVLGDKDYIQTVWGRGYVLQPPKGNDNERKYTQQVFEPKVVSSKHLNINKYDRIKRAN